MHSDPHDGPPTETPLETPDAPTPLWARGPLAWMASNTVAANLLMALFILGGILMIGRVKQEVFPEIDLDVINVQIAYPGASPSEVEEGVVRAVEEAIRSVDGIKELTSTATEGGAQINAELELSTDRELALSDIQSAVDRVTSLPADAERPVISLVSNRRAVISLVLYGDASERALRELAEQTREALLQNSRLTIVELEGVRAPQISIEVPQEKLRRYNLTLDQVAQAVRAASVDLPGGGVKTPGGEVLLRTTERRDFGVEFQDIVVLSQPDGAKITVGDLGVVVDGFEEVDRAAYFNGKPAVRVTVYRVGDQTPLELSSIVNAYVEDHASSLPPGIQMKVWDDSSEVYRDRINLLLRNAGQGLILVLLVLGLFLEIRLAFWVTLGIPISFLGAILMMPMLDVSLNMISLFAFIITLGIVVDDAIVVGEAVYTQRQRGVPAAEAAVRGAREVAIPVVFSVLTTVVTFAPLLFVPGTMGKFFRVIPLVVIPILLLSLVESLLILPAHLSHDTQHPPDSVLGRLRRAQARFGDGLEWFIERAYQPVVRRAIAWRYLTVAVGFCALIMMGGMVAGGRLKFVFFPKVESDVVNASVTLPFGSAVEDTQEVARVMVEQAQQTFAQLGGEEALSRGIFSVVGLGGSHTASVQIFLKPAAERDVATAKFTDAWRKNVGQLTGVDTMTFSFSTGPQGGSPVDVELSHPDNATLERAASSLAAKLADFQGVVDIDDGYARGKVQLDYRLRPEARSLGITEAELARQLRSAFFGAEVARQQRGRDEMRVFVRRPLSERRSEFNIEQLLIRTPQGGELPLSEAAEVVRGRSYTQILRKNGRQVVRVTADLNTQIVTADQVLAKLRAELLPAVQADHPGLSFDFGGEQRNRAESLGALRVGMIFALLIMFGMMAVVFKSYAQPLIIMLAIPFGIVGALLGHLIMGYDLSLISMMGMVALSGVVVNDSLVLVDAINQYSKEPNTSVLEAVVAGGMRRFRPIVLTSLTTFFGLAPMILERSVQARFLIPMAISLGFGVLFVTIVALLLVPALYLIIEDAKAATRWVLDLYRSAPAAPDADVIIGPGAE